jgi:hypothetical protein
MTKQRRHGNDTCMSDWLRSQADISSGYPTNICVNDIDYMFHRYAIKEDSVGSRSVHLMMHIETKVLSGMPDANQKQTLCFWHQLTKSKRQKLFDCKNKKRASVWSFGVFVLSVPGFYPGDQGDTVYWCSFDDSGLLCPQEIAVDDLKNILRFDWHPKTLQPLDLRRHHKTGRLIAEEKTELGFVVEREITNRS